MSVKKHGSLFSGIGGFDLAAEWMGWDNKFHCEWNEFGQKVLKYYWPKAVSYGNIKETDFTIWRGGIDVLTGGFPCQPYSLAGKRKGKDDDRHLWPEMLRAIREIQPTYVVGENVFGLINWNGGLVFNEVQADLEAEGYEVWPYVLPACAVNAPHRRDRVWFVAHSKSGGRDRKKELEDNKTEGGERRGCNADNFGKIRCKDGHNVTPNAHNHGSHGSKDGQGDREGNDRDEARKDTAQQSAGCGGEAAREVITHSNSHGQQRGNSEHEVNTGEGWEYALGNIVKGLDNGDAADAGNQGLQWSKVNGGFTGIGSDGNEQFTRCVPPNWENFPTQPPVCSGNDGLSTELDGITVSKHRKESLMAYGNAVVPQVVYEIFKGIELYDTTKTKS